MPANRRLFSEERLGIKSETAGMAGVAGGSESLKTAARNKRRRCGEGEMAYRRIR